MQETNVIERDSLNISPENNFSLKKGEKLRHRSLVEGLFKEGKTIYEFPLRLTWRVMDNSTFSENFRNKPPENIFNMQMLITVPKKKRKRAVDRVLMRRRIREAYRLNRNGLKAEVNKNPDVRLLSMAFVYMHNENLPYVTIEKKIKILFNKLESSLSKIKGNHQISRENKHDV